MELYGNLINRLQEKAKGLEPKVGLDVTEYLYSDRNVYEIINVENNKNFTMRRYDVKHNGPFGSQDWELISDEKNPTYDMVYRYNKWYQKLTYTKESLNKSFKENGYVLVNNKTFDKAMKDGIAYEYIERNIVIGVSDYYYDFEF